MKHIELKKTLSLPDFVVEVNKRKGQQGVIMLYNPDYNEDTQEMDVGDEVATANLTKAQYRRFIKGDLFTKLLMTVAAFKQCMMCEGMDIEKELEGKGSMAIHTRPIDIKELRKELRTAGLDRIPEELEEEE